MSRPWLSVLMPTYNGAAHLAAALESVAAQADSGVEVIAVDDGSTDATVSILRSFADRLALRILQPGRTGEWAANTNHALARARADHVCLLHQDDLWLPGRLNALKRLVARWPTATLFLHPSWFIGADGERLGLWRCPFPACRPLSPAFAVGRLLVQNFIAAPAALFRHDTALAAGGLDPVLWYTADWDFWLKLAASGPTVYCSQPLAAFRIHPLSQTVVRGSQVGEVRRQLELVLERHLSTSSGRSPGPAAVHRAAHFSIDMNVHLLARYHGEKSPWVDLLRRFLRLGPAGWRLYLRDSRILERVLARLRGLTGVYRSAAAQRRLFDEDGPLLPASAREEALLALTAPAGPLPSRSARAAGRGGSAARPRRPMSTTA